MPERSTKRWMLIHNASAVLGEFQARLNQQASRFNLKIKRSMPEVPVQVSTTGHPPMSRLALFKEHVYLTRFGFTLFVILMGAATATPSALPEASTLLVLMLIGWGFHMTYYGFNDAADYELDKVLGKKDDHPLVRGDISRKTALTITLAHTIGLFLVELFSGTTFELILLLVIACGCVIIYDVFGKRNPFPPLTDAIEGIGFLALALYGAMKVGTPTALSWILAINFAIFTNFITGYFLGIVDLKGDFASGARTTPIWFGMRPAQDSQLPHIPRTLTILGSLQLLIILFVNFLPLLRNDFHYPPMTLLIVSTIVAAISIGLCMYVIRFIVSGTRWQKIPEELDNDRIAVYSISLVLVSYLPFLSAGWLMVLAICVFAPLFVGKFLGRL
jgi:4-hydroxybenzoate polyprenyltransferase